MNGFGVVSSKECAATREAMRKEDEAEDDFEATAQKLKGMRTQLCYDSGTARLFKYRGVLCTYAL